LPTFDHQIVTQFVFGSMLKNVFKCYPIIIIHPIDLGSISTIDATIGKKLDYCPKKFNHYQKPFVISFHHVTKDFWLPFNFFFQFLPKNVLVGAQIFSIIQWMII
jgi:hypothetical protein